MTDSERIHGNQKGGWVAALFLPRRAAPLKAIAPVLAVASLVASFCIPNHYPPWGAAEQDMLAGIGTSFLLIWLVASRQSLAITPAALLFFALAATPLLQFAWGQIRFFGDAWIASLYLVCGGVAVICGHAARRSQGQCAGFVLAASVLAAGLLSCVLALAQRFRINWGPAALFLIDVQPGHAPFANLAQPNHLGTLLVISVACLAYLYERGYVRRRLGIVAAVIIVVCVALTESRAAGLLLAALSAWRLTYQRRVSHGRVASRFVAFLIGVWALSYVVWPRFTVWADVGTMASLGSRLQPGPRTILWQQLLDAALRKPWFGYGWNQVSVAQMSVAADYGRTRFTEHSHNILLDMMIWVGIPLAIAILALAVRWLAIHLTRVRTPDAAFAVSIVLIFAVHSLVEFPLDYLYFLVPFGLALGFLESEDRNRPIRTMTTAGSGILAVTMITVSVTASLDYLRFEDSYRDLRFSVAHIGTPLIFKDNGPPPTEFTQLGAFFRFALMQPTTDMSKKEIEFSQETATRFPYVPALTRLATIQALNGDAAGAALTFRRIRMLHGDLLYWQARDSFARRAEREPLLRQVQLAP